MCKYNFGPLDLTPSQLPRLVVQKSSFYFILFFQKLGIHRTLRCEPGRKSLVCDKADRQQNYLNGREVNQ